MSGGRLYLLLGGGALVLAALSLLIPSTPSYDPWAWLVWGREIAHINLQTTGGPSWKPLPVLFTTAFSLFGKAQPDLWLVVARAGALVGVAMVFKLAWRLTRDLVAGITELDGASRRLAVIPPLLAGLVAAGSLVNSGGFVSNNALGYSEGVATALGLIAVDSHLDGARHRAFVVGFFAALDRPELWFVWGPYGLYLFWRDPAARKLVVALFALIPILWFLPELWGSGHLLRGVTRAQHPRSNSAAFAKCPVCTVFRKEAWPAVMDRVKIPGRSSRCSSRRSGCGACAPGGGVTRVRSTEPSGPARGCSVSACSASVGGWESRSRPRRGSRATTVTWCWGRLRWRSWAASRGVGSSGALAAIPTPSGRVAGRGCAR